MKKFILIIAIITLSFSTSFSQLKLPEKLKPSTDFLNWHTDMDKALKIAKKENKFILIFFCATSWSPWCLSQDAKVFRTQEFKEYAENNLVLVRVEFDISSMPISEEFKQKHIRLAQMYKIEGFPTEIILAPTWRTLAEIGYTKGGPANFILILEDIKKDYNRSITDPNFLKEQNKMKNEPIENRIEIFQGVDSNNTDENTPKLKIIPQFKKE